MCNLYHLKVRRWELIAYHQAQDDRRAELEKDYVAPGRPAPVVTVRDGQRSLDEMTWGWPFQGKRVVNVRNYDSPFWRSALNNPARRCLVPFTTFQKWSLEADPTTGKKRPYNFGLPSRPIGTFAVVWRPSGAESLFAFLTCG